MKAIALLAGGRDPVREQPFNYPALNDDGAFVVSEEDSNSRGGDKDVV